MKKVLFWGILFLFSLSVFAQGEYKITEGNEAIGKVTSIQRIMVEASQEVLDAENELNLEIVHLQFDLIRGNDWKWTYRTLYPGNRYVIYAAGESIMVKDLDLKIMWQHPDTKEWNLVHEDDRITPDAIAFAEPSGAALRYAIGVRIPSYKEGWNAGHYYIMIAHPIPDGE